jgi:hypothetical protein
LVGIFSAEKIWEIIGKICKKHRAVPLEKTKVVIGRQVILVNPENKDS